MIINMDCREGLQAFADGSFDVVIADPPYGDTSLEWDTKVTGWIPAISRVLKPCCSVWIFGSFRFLAPLFAEMERHGFKYSQDIVWQKQNGTGFHNDRFRRVHEHVVMFYRGKWSDVYKNTQYTMDALPKVVRRKTGPTHTGNIDAAHYVSEDGGPRLMRSVLQVSNEHGRAIHPTQKPVDIIRPLLRYSVPPGGVVLDPFAGSGSTIEAARIEGFNAIGFEIDAQYADIATNRLTVAA